MENRLSWPRLAAEVVKRSDVVHRFVMLPRRWVVERTFGWLMPHDPLVRDCERTELGTKSPDSTHPDLRSIAAACMTGSTLQPFSGRLLRPTERQGCLVYGERKGQ